MNLRNIAAAAVVSIAVVLPNVSSASSAISIVGVTSPMGTTHVQFSNGVDCVDNDGHPRVGPVANFHNNYFLGIFASGYGWTQDGSEDNCS